MLFLQVIYYYYYLRYLSSAVNLRNALHIQLFGKHGWWRQVDLLAFVILCPATGHRPTHDIPGLRP